jgi:hypothetical protein
MGTHQKILFTLDEIGYKDVTIAELLNILTRQPPMMPIIGYDEDTGGPKFLNGIRIDDSGAKPILFLYFSESPKKNPEFAKGYDEELADKKDKAMEMAKESDRSMKFLQHNA